MSPICSDQRRDGGHPDAGDRHQPPDLGAGERVLGELAIDVRDLAGEKVDLAQTYPEFVRRDNGPEMTSHALRDWCRFSRTGAAFIRPGSPWKNPFVESFNSASATSDSAERCSAAWPRRR
jgi:transposase InsO family protein